jgi:hypothetical protein
MCRQLEDYDKFGYSCFIFRFLDIDYEEQKVVMNKIDEICSISRRDKKIHTLTFKRMKTQFISENYGMVVYVGYKRDSFELVKYAHAAGAIQQALTGIREWITLCIYLDDNRHFINQFYYHFGDEESEILGNRALQDFHVDKKKVGRNDKCPCGSNLKYKMCCGR